MSCSSRAVSLGLTALMTVAGGTHPADAPGSGVRIDHENGAVRYTNHLVSEQSPYLQLHAHNPVDWYPWGLEAFERARREDKPIFLSIGYSTCHWCHVMEAESFSNPAIADLLNRSFVAIKVDREERPDIDRIYLAYVTSVASGGWPMTVVLTPDLKPFFGATYLPPDTRDGREGLRSLVPRLADIWRTQREAVLKAAADGTSTVTALAQIPPPADSTGTARALEETYESLTRSFDRTNGGFGAAPKFPRPVVLTFLLRYYARTKAKGALDMTLATLRAMAHGGLHDQLDGGFHRYTVDAEWRIPHFEKMLYDQAQLAVAYTDAFQLTRDTELAEVARGTLDYVLRRLRDPAGGFSSAEDADSPVSRTDRRLAEGAYYVWTRHDVERVLGRDAPLAAYYFDLPNGTGTGSGAVDGGALAVRHTVRETAVKFGLTEPAVRSTLDAARERLMVERDARPRPARDDKIVAAWNGLMISALARAAEVFDDRPYLEAGLDAARFVEARLFDPSSLSLKRRYREGTGNIDAQLEDYAFLVQGLLDLYEVSFDPRWLSLASRLQGTQDRLFWDVKDGAYFSTRADTAHLLARMKEDYDGAEPAANSVSALNLLRLWQLTAVDTWRLRADATFRALSGRVARSGTAVPQLMAALEFNQSTPKQIVIAGDPGAPDTQALLRAVHQRFIPNKVLALVDGGPGQGTLTALAPQFAEMTRRGGHATIYVCEHYACHLPTTDPAVAARLLDTQ
jgi:uncharacterized protein YyaL (SSP411 family)